MTLTGFWTLDPIDGTTGFLRGGQYAVCLSLIENGEPQVSVLACPNFPYDWMESSKERGMLFYGVAGDKAFEKALFNNTTIQPQVCTMRMIENFSQATFCESYESGHSSHKQQAEIAKLLGIRTDSVRMDSQAKYAAITRGSADIYLRLPSNMNYEEKIWVLSFHFRF